MNLIYAPNPRVASSLAQRYELMPGDWKWIRDGRAFRDHPRADVYKAPHWEAHPRREEIDAALEHAREKRRLGMLTDAS